MIYLSLANLPNRRLESMKWKLLPWRSHQSLWISWRWRKKRKVKSCSSEKKARCVQFVRGVQSSVDLSIYVTGKLLRRSEAALYLDAPIHVWRRYSVYASTCVRVKHNVNVFCFYWSCFVLIQHCSLAFSIWWITDFIMNCYVFIINFVRKILEGGMW